VSDGDWNLKRSTQRVFAGSWIGGIVRSATRRTVCARRGSSVTFTGAEWRLPGETFHFCPSHWSSCIQTTFPSARRNSEYTLTTPCTQ
jgi:hypothetical protein